MVYYKKKKSYVKKPVSQSIDGKLLQCRGDVQLYSVYMYNLFFFFVKIMLHIFYYYVYYTIYVIYMRGIDG